VLSALILREMATRFGRSYGGYFWAIAEPAAVIALLSLVFSELARRPPIGDSFAFYFASGYLAFHIYSDIAMNISQSVRVNLTLLNFPRVTPLDTILARFVLQSLTVIVVFVIMITAIAMADGVSIRPNPAAIAFAIVLAQCLGLAVGTLNCVIFAIIPVWERIFGIINRPLFLISGIFFEYDSLPRYAQDLIWYNPLVHIVALMRRGLFPTYSPDFISIPYVVFLIFTVGLLGILMLRAFHAKVIEP